jgi:hypothetical protein
VWKLLLTALTWIFAGGQLQSAGCYRSAPNGDEAAAGKAIQDKATRAAMHRGTRSNKVLGAFCVSCCVWVMLNEDLQIKCDNIWRRAFESVIAQLKLGYVVGHREDAKLMETKVYPKTFSIRIEAFFGRVR